MEKSKQCISDHLYMPPFINQGKSRETVFENYDINVLTDKNKLRTIDSFVLFIGSARSGTTITASIIDAHPNAIIAREYSIIKKMVDRGSVNFKDMIKFFKGKGERGKYSKDFAISKWSNCKYGNFLKVFGDKRAANVTRCYILNGIDVFLDFQNRIGNIPLKFICLTRNPFDVIAKQHLFSLQRKPEKRMSLEECIEYSISCNAAVSSFKKDIVGTNIDIYTVCLDDLLANSESQIIRLYEYLNLSIDIYFIKKLKSFFRDPVKRRDSVEWKDCQIDKVYEIIKGHDHLKEYVF